VELRGVGDPGLALAVRRLAAALAAVTVIRLAVAAMTPLAPDETYYWIWSHALAAGYLDHPPMVAFWIKAGSLLAGQTAFGVRLLGPLAAALASWMLFDAGARLFPGTNAGVVAAVLLNASLLLGVGSVIMTPDSPLLFFWTAAFWALVRIAIGGGGGWWLAAGVFGGLALDSKFTALLLWIGAGSWLLLVPGVRPWLRRWQPWAACVLGFALFAPVLQWNAAHGWAGIIKQGGRIGDWNPARALGFLAELVGGQIGLATPLVWALCMLGLVAAVGHAWRTRDPGWSLLAALSLPPVLVFVQHAVGDRVQGNWPAIVYPALAVAAGGLAVRQGWWAGAAALGFTVTALAYVQATTAALPLPPRLDPVAMRLAGWDGLARQLQAAGYRSDATFVAADGYALASELAWWMPESIPIVDTDDRWRLTALPTISIAGQAGLLVRDVGRGDPPGDTAWRDVRRVGTVTRPGAAGPDYAVYRVVGVGTGVALPGR
jgi:4-amino-4-deoxy-L-arabinose transferase-like glycosyltransferase